MTATDDKARPPLSAEQTRRLLRWRMALGRYADKQLDSSGLSADELRRDQLLERIYAERASQRGLRLGGSGRKGSLDPSQITIPDWLNESRRLFPDSVFETIQGHALNDLGLAGLFDRHEHPRALRVSRPSDGG